LFDTSVRSDPTRTPILSGLYPDPTICRVGDDYFLANSSMEFSPGAPVWHSSDLVRWTQIGNALQANSQFPSGVSKASHGTYAPTLRYRDGLFFLIGTNVDDAGGGHWLLTSSDASGPWSDPTFIRGIDGIDPDICWDEAGTCLVTYCSWDNERAGIKQVAIDPASGALLEEPRWVWHGSGLSHPEGPHLYRRGEWWYLVIAEGGTERGHVVSVARARSPRGPYEGASHNPIFTHRSVRHPVQNIGHADLFELADGTWAAVYLGVRVRGGTPRFHVNGRETFLSRIEWIDGWPDFVPFDAALPGDLTRISDEFAALPLHPRWVSPGLRPESLMTATDAGMVLNSAESTSGAPSGLFTRVPAEYWEARFDISAPSGTTRMLLRLDERHWYALRATSSGVAAISRVGDVEAIIAQHPLDNARPLPFSLIFRATPNDAGGPDRIELRVRQGETAITLTTLDGRYLSTEVAGGFTGRVIGLVSDDGHVRVHGFFFEETDPNALEDLHHVEENA